AVVVGALVFIVRLPRRSYSVRYDDPSPGIRAAALREARGSDRVALFMRALKDPDVEVQIVAAMQLTGAASIDGWAKSRRAAEAIPALIEALRAPHRGLRSEAAEALSRLGEATVPALCEALADPDPRVRASAARALGDLPSTKAASRERSPRELEMVTPLL